MEATAKTVLVTSIGSTAGDAVIRTLHRLGHRVVGSDIYARELVVDSMNVDAFYQVPLVRDAERFTQVLEEICEKEGVEIIVPLTDLDVDYFNVRRAWLDERDITCCISGSEALGVIRDKRRLAEFIERGTSGVLPIPTMMMSDCERAPWPYPVVCKPLDGRSSQGLKYVTNDAEWDALKGSIAGTADEARYMVQPKIEGRVGVCEMVRNPQTGQCVCVVRQEYLRTMHGLGLSVRVYHDAAFEEKMRWLADELGICGCVNCEFICDDRGVYHFLECNPRPSAGVNFSCLAGYDCITNHLRCFTGEPIDDFVMQGEMYIARKYVECVTYDGRAGEEGRMS